MAAAALLAAALRVPAAGQTTRKEPYPPYFQQHVQVVMEVSLHPETHVLNGETWLTYRNHSPDTLTKLYFHLYTNAYRPGSVFARQEKKFFRPQIEELGPDEMGWIRVWNLRVAGAPVMAEWPYAPDSTLFRIPLPRPLLPGAEVIVEMDWAEQLSTFVDRAGRDDGIPQYDFAQWYPKPVVWDRRSHEAGKWVNAIPFHAVGEFYGEFGTFDVTIDVPDAWVVAATGIPIEGDPGWEDARASPAVVVTYQRDRYGERAPGAGPAAGGASAESAPPGAAPQYRRVRFYAEDVHDFAWSTSPRFAYEEARWNGRVVRSLYRDTPADRAAWAGGNAERGVRALEWLSDIYGLYPYPQVTILHGLLGGGMEYPMLVMDASPGEGLILHEVGHIYSYGIWGNNEWLEAWMDEGMTSFQTRWYMEQRYGPFGAQVGFEGRNVARRRDWLSRLLGPREECPLDLRRRVDLQVLPIMLSGLDQPVSTAALEFRDGAAYGVNAYPKGSLVFETLRYVVGEDAFRRILHEYFDRYHFRHVTESDFRKVAEEVSGQDLGWFFQTWLHTVPVFDYRLDRVSVGRGPSGYRTLVEVERAGDRMPVEVEARFEDGSTARRRLDGVLEREPLAFESSARPVAITLDPGNEILDWNRTNNVWPRRRAFAVGSDWPGHRPEGRDQVFLRGRPSFAYNSVDHLRLGVAWNGEHPQPGYRRFEAHASVGVESGAVNGSVGWRGALLPRHPQWLLDLNASRLEGRARGGASVTHWWQSYLQRPPYHRLTIGAEALLVTDSKYVDERLWQDADVGALFARYSLDVRGQIWSASLALEGRGGLDVSSDRAFGVAFGELRWGYPAFSRSGVRFRSFVGMTTSGTPVQERFFARGASPREWYRHAPLRSRGSPFTRVDYHLPGGANLRGFRGTIHAGPDGDEGVALVAALNAEVRRGFGLPPWLRPLAWGGQVALFGDFAWFAPAERQLEDLLRFGEPGTVGEAIVVDRQLRSRDVFGDAGVGLRFFRRINDTEYLLRIDFPVWASEPRLARGDDPFDFRYALSLEIPW